MTEETSALLGTRESEIKEVPLDSIYIDMRFQRISNPHKVDKIRRQYHPKGVGYILVAKVFNNGALAQGEKGEPYACIDGQTRIRGLRERAEDIKEGRAQGDTPATVKAEVFPELTAKEAALLFRLRNDQNPVKPWSRDRVAVTEGDPTMLKVVEQAAKAGYTVFNDDDDRGTMPYLVEAKRVVSWGDRHGYPDLLADALNVQAQAFGVEGRLENTVERTVLTATADLLWRNRELNEDELARVLATKGIFGLTQEAAKSADKNQIRLFKATKMVMVDAYNRGKRGSEKIRL